MKYKKVESFLEKLSKLTIKYGIKIGGCGCCGSPFLEETTRKGHYQINEESNDSLGFIEEETEEEKQRRLKREEEHKEWMKQNPGKLPF